MVVIAALGAVAARGGQRGALSHPTLKAGELRLYVFDCGHIDQLNPATWGFKPGELARPAAAVPCHLVVHSKGTLVWDAGVVPDAAIGSGAPGADRAGKPLREQLAAIGYRPEDITYFALSHYHVDHAANANMFAGSTWLVRSEEREAMFGTPPPPVGTPAHFSALEHSRTVLLKEKEHDVFGDGSVVIHAAVGHTPGHQVLILKLPKTGPVVLAGDLYHFPEQRREGMGHVPTFEFDPAQSRRSRAEIEALAKQMGAQFWIEHDVAANERLRKSPNYYD